MKKKKLYIADIKRSKCNGTVELNIPYILFLFVLHCIMCIMRDILNESHYL